MTSYKTAWELASAHVTDMLHVLDVIGARGIRVDTERLANFNSTLDTLLAEAQVEFDADEKLRPLRGWHPKEGYKKTPKDLTGLEQHEFHVPWRPSKKDCTQATDYPIRWARRKSFLATSSQQVKNYMLACGHAVPHTRDGDDTTGQKQLLLMWRKYKDEHYRQFVEFRKLKKLRGTYGEWPTVERDGETFATTTFTLRPDNGRLSSVNPNVQNIPRDGELACLFKSCLVARRGHKLLRADLSSAEALVTGWLSHDEVAMRIARLGTHKYATAKYVGLPVSLDLSDADLQPLLKKAKDENPVLYRKIKTCIFGGNYLAGPRKLFEQNPEEFESQADAKKFQQFCKSLFPKIGVWQRQTIAQAKAAKGLYNPFGYYKAFWDIEGGDAPSAVAFLPSSIIAAVMKECMLDLFYNFEAGKYMIWQIHDELVFDVPEEKLELVQQQVRETMTRSWPQLDGLAIPAEVRVSDSMV